VAYQHTIVRVGTFPGIDTQRTAPDDALTHSREMFMTSTGTTHGTTLIRGSSEAAEVDPAGVQHALQLAANWVVEGTTPALVVLAARRGVMFLHEAFGRLTPEAESPALRPDSIYPVASLSKPVTATAVLCLVEDGLVGLDHLVRDYVPEFTGAGKDAVTVRHLLTHTSGLRDELVEGHVRQKLASGGLTPDGRTEPESLALFPPYVMYWHFESGLDAPLGRPPGTELVYSSYGYAALGEVIQRVSGRSFTDFCRERILAPLGMDQSYFEVPEETWARVVRRPESFPPAHLNVRERIPAAMPQGGLSSTAWDLAIFGQMFLNGGGYGAARVLSPASVAQMTHDQVPVVLGSKPGVSYGHPASGLGWWVNVPEAVHVFHASQLSAEAFVHGGSGGSLVCIDPARELIVVWLSIWAGADLAKPNLFVDALVESIIS
jgi:CubicO group peptidase (beta-lactamase class C family)